MKYKSIFFILLFLNGLCFGDENVNNIREDLPEDKQGLFPIHIPEYHGIEQLILLSNRWVIVVFNDAQEVREKIDQLSNGKYFKSINDLVESVKIDRTNWAARDAYLKLFDENFAHARNLAGERTLDEASTYSIQSSDDPRYKEPISPVKVTRMITSIGNGKLPEEYSIRYAHNCYLEFPHPMENNKHYTITITQPQSVNNGKSTTFIYDELRSVSRAIKVNQVGYLPSCKKKFAYLGSYLQEYGPQDFSNIKEFSVISVETGKTVLKWPVNLRAKNVVVPLKKADDQQEEHGQPFLTGEDVYEMDLRGLNEVGNFFITIPGVGRSWAFRHAPDVYGDVFYIGTRGFYHQRCGIALGEPYTAWPRIKCHTEPVYESDGIPDIMGITLPKEYEVFDVVGGSIDMTRQTVDATGGLHDAADWDRNLSHYTNIFDLLNVYQIYSHKFTDNQLNLPESGNGIPDILSEVEYDLKLWKKSMREDGAVAGMIETSTHPRIDDPKFHYAYSLRTRWASLIYAAAAAQYASIIKKYDENLAREYRETAIKAYQFGADPKNTLTHYTIHAAKNRGTGEKYSFEFNEKEEFDTPYLIHAKLQLFLLTDDKIYLNGIEKLLLKSPPPYGWPFQFYDFSPWIYYGLFSEKVAGHIPKLVIRKWEEHFIKPAEQLLKDLEQQPYRQSWPHFKDYWMSWGATNMANQARALCIAYIITNDERYREAAILNMDFMLGANPKGMCWTTGLGFVYPIEIQHEVSENDGIMDPVPGITIFGVNEGIFYDLRKSVWEWTAVDKSEKFLKEKNLNIPLWRRWFAHPHLNVPQNEFSVSATISATAFVSAVLLMDDWSPSTKLKDKHPRRDDLLFGNWYLP